MFNRVPKPLVTSETRPLSLTKQVFSGEINQARPSNKYDDSCLLHLQACPPSSVGAKPNLFCYAATEVAHKPAGADLQPPRRAAAKAVPGPDVKLTLPVLHHDKSPAVTAHILQIWTPMHLAKGNMKRRIRDARFWPRLLLLDFLIKPIVGSRSWGCTNSVHKFFNLAGK